MIVDESWEGGENTTILIKFLFKLASQVYQNSKHRSTETGVLKTEFSVFCPESDLI